MTMSPSESHEAPVRPGLVLGRYELLTPIASGGMAQVWAARLKGARKFQKIVAVKTMLPQLSEDEHFEQMFLDEASLASQIRHPNAVETLDLGEQDGVLYLVMEWIEGVPLHQLLKKAKAEGGVPSRVATRIIMGACAGLHAAHELQNEKGQHVGLVHRDVSPQNLLVTYDGVTKVVDFGVAKATAIGGGATMAGQVKGKVSYMSPEQVSGEDLDRRSDVFALGIVLYALTTGKHPFRKESEGATMFNICSPDKVISPAKVVPHYPPLLEPIVMKALEKNRDDRYRSCDEMLRALDALPSELRASSDADVGSFVVSLLGEQRSTQKAKLNAAIELADQSATKEGWGSTTAEGQRSPASLRYSVSGAELSELNTGLLYQSKRPKWLIPALFGLGATIAAIVTTLAFNSDESEGPTENIVPNALTSEEERDAELRKLAGKAISFDQVAETDEEIPQQQEPAIDDSSDAIDLDAEAEQLEKQATQPESSKPRAPQADAPKPKPPKPKPPKPKPPKAKPKDSSSNWKYDSGL